jgi:hypothetical protein
MEEIKVLKHGHEKIANHEIWTPNKIIVFNNDKLKPFHIVTIVLLKGHLLKERMVHRDL